ncbi:hypothetical protein N9064_00015 [bacterium]|nr:hypothetical protein [bacterium]
MLTRLTREEQQKLSQELLEMLITNLQHPKHYLLNYVWFILVRIITSGKVCKEDALYCMNALVLLSYYEHVFRTDLGNGHIELHFTRKLIDILKDHKEQWDNEYKTFNNELEQLLDLQIYEDNEGVNESNYRSRLVSRHTGNSEETRTMELINYGLDNAERFNLSFHECLFLYLTLLDIEQGNPPQDEKNLKAYVSMFENNK